MMFTLYETVFPFLFSNYVLVITILTLLGSHKNLKAKKNWLEVFSRRVSCIQMLHINDISYIEGCKCVFIE